LYLMFVKKIAIITTTIIMDADNAALHHRNKIHFDIGYKL